MSSLSQSALWSKMQEYYNNIGPEAWQNELVPMQISSNKNLASAYANIIVAQILDWQAKNQNQHSNEPFHILEIGAGHGKFGFYVLKSLQELCQNYSIPLSMIKFVITDIAEKNIQSWQAHPAFKPWLERGTLDFALFNAMSDQEINLIHSKQAIKTKSLHKPIFMICNYLFDSLSHDAFQVENKQLREVQIKISSDADWEEYFAKASFSYNYEPVTSEYYKDPNLNKILAEYQQELQSNTFMIPIGGIDCINMVKQFSTAPLVLLLADKGQASMNLFDDLGEPDISVHGSISLMVNFDALRRYFNNMNGSALLMSNNSVDFQVACYITEHDYSIAHTKHAFSQTLNGASPQDIINLCYIEDEINTKFANLDQMLAILNLTLWDPNIFCDFHETMLDKIEEEEITVEQDNVLLAGVKIVWDYFFKLEKNQDLPFAIGSIYYALDEYDSALEFYKLSISEFGANAESLYNVAITLQALEEISEARNYAEQAIKLDSEYTAAQELLEELA